MAKNSSQPGLAELQAEVALLSDDFPRLADDDLFVVWFLFAYVTGDKSGAAAALTGKSGEKGLDAIHIDEAARLVTLVQGKYRQSLMRTAESRSSIMEFAGLAEVLTGGRDRFEDFSRDLEGAARTKFEEARERVLKRKYRLNLHFATLGRCSPALQSEAKRLVRAVEVPARQRPRLMLLTGSILLAVLADYLDGVAPPVPQLELSVQGRPEEQFDEGNGVASWIFSMNGNDVGELFDQAGKKVFARNIRGFLGETGINKGMRETLRKEPGNFWYLNNGVTVVCDRAEFESSAGRERLTVSNPQIINGQQTTRVLAGMPSEAARARVSVRVISVPRQSGDRDFAAYDELVARIVQATNSQNQIRPSDLRSNDRIQVTLEREFQKLGYHYQRKRASAQELAALGRQYEWRLSKEQLARDVTAAIRLPGVGHWVAKHFSRTASIRGSLSTIRSTY